jgi:2-aminoadipate transaminase
MTQTQGTHAKTSEKILFTRGVPALEALPAHLISECMQAVLDGPAGAAILQYGHNGGYLPLRQLLAKEYGVSEDQVLVGNGSLHLQDMIAALLVKPEDVVLTEQPSYDRAIKTFRRRGAKVIGIPLEHDGVDLKLLEKAVVRQTPSFMYLVPDFQNPSGITTSLEKRKALAAMAERHDFWLVEDVPYRQLRYTGDPLPLLRSISPQRVLTISSYSKLISPSLRVGYLVGPIDFVDKLRKLAEDTILSPVLPSQACVVEFIQRGYFTSNLATLKHLYAPRMHTMIDALKQYLPQVSFAEPEGGFFVSITLPESAKIEMRSASSAPQNLLAHAEQAGLMLTDGRNFFADPIDEHQDRMGERFVRLPFCALTPEQIEEGVKRLAKVIKGVEGQA